jgi:hypothetical protein
MSAADLQTKQEAVAEILSGTVVDDRDRVAVSIRGTIDGCPARLEAVVPHWPFGVMYTVESIHQPDPNSSSPVSRITLYPRIGRGMAGLLTNILLFEGNTTRVNEKRLDGVFNFNFENREHAERFIHYPTIGDSLLLLEERSQFSECVIRPDAGIYLTQPKSFNSLDLDNCEETFNILAQLVQTLSGSI